MISLTLVTLLVTVVVAAIFFRRAELHASATARQLEAFRTELKPRLDELSERVRMMNEADRQYATEQSALSREARQALLEQVSHLAERVEAVSAALSALDAGVSVKLAAVEAQVAAGLSALDVGVSAKLAAVEAEVAAAPARLTEFSAEVAGAMGQVASAATVKLLSDDVASLKAAVELILRRPAGTPAISADALSAKSQEELIAIAESITCLRPLVPYPNWRFDADLTNPDLAFQLRRWVWEHSDTQKLEIPVVTPWHSGTRLRLFLGNDTSRQIYVAGCIDPNEFAFLDRFLQPGMTFLDAGANEGIYSIFAAKRVGRHGIVWAFEPSTRELSRLQHNLDLNQLTARIFPLALADCSTRAELTIAGYNHAGQNTLGAFVYDVEIEKKDLVEVRTLDEILEKNPLARLDLMKVDVEGAELRLFHGAVTTLRRYRPVLLFEVAENSLQHQGASRRAVLDFLRGQDYLISNFDGHTGLPCTALPGVFSDNMIACPAERPLPASTGWAWPAGGPASLD
uniref:Methyltransferase FkbM family n=1 Tax=Solibacter usitatus (strain Ellin6076) TaxID=234267 RepID=Q02BC2_SOLUE